MQKMKPITIKMTEEMLFFIDKVAEEEGAKRSEVIRAAIRLFEDEYTKKNGKQPRIIIIGKNGLDKQEKNKAVYYLDIEKRGIGGEV